MPDKPETPSIRSRFPAPWRVEKTPSGYRIEALNGKNVAYVYEEDESVRRAIVNHVTPTEARSIAKAIASLPELMSISEEDNNSVD